jgi:hypothetical protein
MQKCCSKTRSYRISYLNAQVALDDVNSKLVVTQHFEGCDKTDIYNIYEYIWLVTWLVVYIPILTIMLFQL